MTTGVNHPSGQSEPAPPGEPALPDRGSREWHVARIAGWLRVFVEVGQVFELRALNVTRGLGNEKFPATVTGYFDYDHINDAAETAWGLSDHGRAKGVYFTLNCVCHDLLARCCNKVCKAKSGDSTSDHHIVRRRWLYLDFDPIRDAKISATDEEKRRAADLLRSVRLYLAGRGWPDPVIADSGNGFALLYRIDLPADDGGLVEAVLNALASHFNLDGAGAKLDTTVHNPARITKIPGTWARKGDNCPQLGRPHRLSGLLVVPGCDCPESPESATVEVLTEEQLRALVADLGGNAPEARPHLGNGSGPAVFTVAASGRGGERRLKVEEFLNDRGIAFETRYRNDDGQDVWRLMAQTWPGRWPLPSAGWWRATARSTA